MGDELAVLKDKWTDRLKKAFDLDVYETTLFEHVFDLVDEAADVAVKLEREDVARIAQARAEIKRVR